MSIRNSLLEILDGICVERGTHCVANTFQAHLQNAEADRCSAKEGGHHDDSPHEHRVQGTRQRHNSANCGLASKGHNTGENGSKSGDQSLHHKPSHLGEGSHQHSGESHKRRANASHDDGKGSVESTVVADGSEHPRKGSADNSAETTEHLNDRRKGLSKPSYESHLEAKGNIANLLKGS